MIHDSHITTNDGQPYSCPEGGGNTPETGCLPKTLEEEQLITPTEQKFYFTYFTGSLECFVDAFSFFEIP